MTNKSFYLVVEQYGDLIQERYIQNGEEKIREVQYEPTLFIHAKETDDSKYKDIYGRPCIKKKFATIKEAKEWRQNTSGIVDVLGMEDFKLAYISDTNDKEISYDRKLVRVANCDIEVTAPEFPDPTFAKYEIDAITHYDSIDDKYYVFDLLNSSGGSVSKWDIKLAAKSEADGGDEVPQNILDKVVYMDFTSEKEMLLEYIRLWEEKTPVIFTGWNIEGFDIPYIMNRVKNVLGSVNMKRFSPFGRITSKVISNAYGNETEVFKISGVNILDYMDLYKKFSFTSQPTYKLDFIAKYETGRGKLEYEGAINKLRMDNHQRYISYNIMDVESVQAIDDKRGFINLSISMGYYAKINFASVMSPVKTWDSIIFNSLKDEKLVLPEAKSHIRQPYAGAYVKDPTPGPQKYVMSFDVTSLN